MNFFAYIPYVFIYTISRVPIRGLYFLSDLSYVLVFYLAKYRRGVVNTNLKNSFPNKSDAELKKIEKGYYKHFCDLIFESIKTLTISEKSIKKRLKFKNPELIDNYYKDKRSVILYMGHYGNWEWFAGFSLYVQHQMTAFYQPLSNKLFDRLIKESRERFGLIAIKSVQGYKSLASFKNQGKLTFSLVLGDQSPPKQSSKHWVQFLNQETAFLTGTDRMAKKLDHVVLFPHVEKISRGHYLIEFKIIRENMSAIEEYEIIESYAKQLEASINENPQLWLWSHRRWKLAKSGSAIL